MAISAAMMQQGLSDIYASSNSGISSGGKTSSVLKEAEYLRTKVKMLHEQLDSIAQDRRATALGIAKNPDGELVVLAASSEPRLTPAQTALLYTNEIAVNGPRGVHAEIKILNYSLEHGLTLEKITASRPICTECAPKLLNNGVELIGPIKKP